MSGGVTNSIYYELRFWSYARSQSQIQNSRFQQLDPDIERPYMYTYSKLMSANAVQNQGEIDFSDYSLQRAITPYNVKWVTVQDLIVCPLGMFKGQYEIQTCYREGIIQMQGFVYRNSTHYFVSSYSIIFRNNYLRDNAYSIYNYTWNINSMDTKNNTNTQLFPSFLSKQSNAQNLVFRNDEVSNRPGKYDLQLNLIDKNNYQNQYTTNVIFRTYSCANIFDPESKQSLVYMDMDTQRGVENAVFYYDYSECDDFRFDQSSVTFNIDVNDQFGFQSKDHNQTEKSFTLRAQLQSKLPINDYFYLRIKGVWKNKTNPTDTIEYNLVYACRYISKIVPKLTPNQYTILKGQTLTIDYKAQYLNLKQSLDNNYKIQWVCPGNLNNYCKDQGNTLKLSYDNFANSGLDFWKDITISLVLSTNFIQGDGTKQSIASVDISWLNVNPDAKITQITTINNKDQVQAFQIDINNLNENQVQLSWNINPSIDRSCYQNSNNRKQFVLNSSCLVEGTVYNVTGNILYNERQQIIWTSSSTFSIPLSPSKGKLTCLKTSGKAYIDEFKCNTTGWVIPNNPARYQFFVTDINDNNQLVAVSSLTTSNQLQTTLPPTKKLIVKVVDDSGGISQTDLSINVTYSYNDAILIQVFNNLNNAKNQLSNYTQPNTINNLFQVASALNSIGSQKNLTLNQSDIIYNVALMIYNQSYSLNKFTQEQQKRSFIVQAVKTLSLITTNSSNFNIQNLNLIQDSLLLLISGNAKSSLDYLLNDNSFQNQFFSIQENILNTLLDQLNKGYITTALMDDPLFENPPLSNISIKVRKILGNYETYLSTKIYEGQQFYHNNSAFKFQITKFSRSGNTQVDQSESYNDLSYTSYYYPLENAIQPTSRQTFTVINFKVSPFIGDYYLNQSATSNTSVYFSYRDEYGNYLSGDNIIDRIKIIYKYKYSPFVFLPNVTTCGYIGINDDHWENKSCSIEFNRQDSQILCHCKHMSYYSIIDDYLIKPQKVPLINLRFRNWTSFIVILYVVLVFVIGTIYTFNKDNQDFRYLHHQEEQQGNIMVSEDSLTIVSLAFKRKVFFMLFAEKYKFSNLFKIYLMLLHPLFQLKYKLDPETPRFYRFLMLYSRMMLLFGLTFWTIRDVKNFEDMKNDPDFSMIILQVVIFIFFGSLLLVPVPILLLCCCRSRYYLIDPKPPSRLPSDNEMLDDPNGMNGGMPEYVENVTDVMIDTNIPIKLLFLINAHKIEDIKKDYQGKLRYATGEISEVGKKLYELDTDIKQQKEAKQVIYARQQPTQSSDVEKEKKKAVEIKVSEEAVPENKDQSDFRVSRSQIGTNFITQSVLIKIDKTNDLSNISNVHGPGGGLLDSNRPLRPRDPHQYSYDISANKTDQNILDMMDVEFQIHEENENLDDEDDHYEETKRREFQYEGGSREMSFNDQRADNQQKQQEDDDAASDQDSIDTQLFTDEKKELIEERNRYGRLFGNMLALCFNLSIFISVLAIYVNEGYYDLDNQYVWVIVFFGAQLVSIFITDIFALLIMALCVTKWFKSRKTCLATWMRESLYIYEDYKYVVQFANTKIQ